MVTDLSESYWTPVGKGVQHGDSTPYTTVGMAGGISSYPNATGLPSRPMCRDNPGIPRDILNRLHMRSLSYTLLHHSIMHFLPYHRAERIDTIVLELSFKA